MSHVSSSGRSAIFAAFSAQITSTFRGPGRPVSRLPLVLGAAVLAVVAGCADPVDPRAPRPTLAATVPAGEAMAQLRTRWAHGTAEERVALRPQLHELRTRYPDEPIRRLIDLYEAWILLELGDAPAAVTAARRLEAPPKADRPGTQGRGNTDDLAHLIDGAALSRAGHPDEALEILLPLLDKLLDAYARELLHEEALDASLAAHRWSDAIRVLEAYYRDLAAFSGDTTLVEAAEGRVDAALQTIPGTALEAALSRYRDRDGLDAPLARRMAARLAAIAVARGDTTLAQRLVRGQRQSDLATLGEQRQTLLELASAQVGARIVGRTVGLVLGIGAGDEGARRRAASLAFGAAEGAAPSFPSSLPAAPSGSVSGSLASSRPPPSPAAPATSPPSITASSSSASAVSPASPPTVLPLTTAVLIPEGDVGEHPTGVDLHRPTLGALLQRGVLVLVGGDTPETSRIIAQFADANEDRKSVV